MLSFDLDIYSIGRPNMPPVCVHGFYYSCVICIFTKYNTNQCFMVREKDFYVSPSVEAVCILARQEVLQGSKEFKMSGEDAGDEETPGF